MADNVDLEQRIAHLEAVVSELQKTLEQLTSPQSSLHSEAETVVGASQPPVSALRDEVVFEAPKREAPQPNKNIGCQNV